MDVARQILVVLLVLILFGGARYALRRGVNLSNWTPPRPAPGRPSLQVVGRVTLTPQHCLHIVRAGDREWVLATHPQGCTTISGGSEKGAEA